MAFDENQLPELDDKSAYSEGASSTTDVPNNYNDEPTYLPPVEVPQDKSLGDLANEPLMAQPENMTATDSSPSYDVVTTGGFTPPQQSWWDRLNTPAVKGNPASTPFARFLGGLAMITPTGQKTVPFINERLYTENVFHVTTLTK